MDRGSSSRGSHGHYYSFDAATEPFILPPASSSTPLCLFIHSLRTPSTQTSTHKHRPTFCIKPSSKVVVCSQLAALTESSPSLLPLLLSPLSALRLPAGTLPHPGQVCCYISCYFSFHGSAVKLFKSALWWLSCQAAPAALNGRRLQMNCSCCCLHLYYSLCLCVYRAGDRFLQTLGSIQAPP